MSVKIAISADEIARCYPVMVQLRPHITSEREFVERVMLQQSEGFQMAYLESKQKVEAVAGFRIFDMLSRGRHMYVDDLITNETSRSKGHGRELFDWLVAHAKSQKCLRLHLDSGVHRFRAHGFYFRQRMHIAAYHFGLALHEER